MDIFTWVIQNKRERIDIPGFGNYGVEAVAWMILEGKAGASYGYLTDCLREKMESALETKADNDDWSW